MSLTLIDCFGPGAFSRWIGMRRAPGSALRANTILKGKFMNLPYASAPRDEYSVQYATLSEVVLNPKSIVLPIYDLCRGQYQILLNGIRCGLPRRNAHVSSQTNM
jgi:hypothetical protein